MFEHLKKKLDVADATSWMDLPEIGPRARLQMRPATQDNPGYLNALLKRSAKRARTVVRQQNPDMAVIVEQMREDRLDDRKVFPLHVIVDWEGIPGDNGQDVEFAPERVLAFCSEEVLPDWLFDRIRNYAGAAENFLPGNLNVESLAGNSESGSASS